MIGRKPIRDYITVYFTRDFKNTDTSKYKFVGDTSDEVSSTTRKSRPRLICLTLAISTVAKQHSKIKHPLRDILHYSNKGTAIKERIN